MDLSVQNSGASKRVTLPAEVVRDLGIESGKQVFARYDREEGTITYFLD